MKPEQKRYREYKGRVSQLLSDNQGVDVDDLASKIACLIEHVRTEAEIEFEARFDKMKSHLESKVEEADDHRSRVVLQATRPSCQELRDELLSLASRYCDDELKELIEKRAREYRLDD